MTSRLLIVGDTHYRTTSPVARTDNFQEAIEAKLVEVFDLAVRHQVEAICHLGDLFDSPQVVYSSVGRLGALLQQCPVPFLTIPGNHDEFGGTPTSLERTPLGLLTALGIVQRVDINPWHSPTGNVVVTGNAYTPDTDVDHRQYHRPEWVKDDAFCVHLVHGMIVDRPIGHRYTTFDQLFEQHKNLPRVLCCGHYHLGFGIKQLGNVMAINPGALCRLSAAIEEIERPVQVALITIDGDQYDAELITLQSARPGDEVLSREHLVAQAEAEQRREKFLELLAGEETQRTLDLVEMVQSIAGREHLPDAVRAEAMRRIGIAQEAMVA